MLPIDPEYVPLYIAIVSGLFAGVGFLFKFFFGERKGPETTDEEKIVDRRKMPKLIYHQIFRELDEQEAYFSTRYKHRDFGRQLLAVEMIVHKIRIWRPILLEFAKKADECAAVCGGESKPECNKIANLAVQAYLKGMDEYIDWHNAETVLSIDGDKIYNKKDKETMSKYVDKFQEWYSSREVLTKIMIHEVGESNMYDSCYKRAYDILQAYAVAFISMKLDAEKSLKSLNGSLTGKTFLGVTIGEE